MRKQLLLFVLGMLPLGISFGQQMDQKMLPSSVGGQNSSMSNLASPNLFDGSTNLNIPIHSFGDLGISLSYNTKGVQVEELSGQIGTHWVLNAGGNITRNMKDIPDEVNQKFDDPAGPNFMKYRILGRAHVYEATGVQPNREYWDGENDEFIVSAGPLQFTFQLGKNGYIFTYPENRYKIEPIANSYNPDGTFIYDKFEITDEQGTKYTFGTHINKGMNGSIVFGNTNISGGIRWEEQFGYTSKWFLDKVEFANGQQINYTYEQIEYPVTDLGIEGLSLYRRANRIYPIPNPNDPNSGFVNSDAVMMDVLEPMSYVLKGIQYPDNTNIDFVFDQGPGFQNNCMKSIKQIEIGQGGNCIKYRFNKAYLQQDTNSYLYAMEVPFDNACNYDPADQSQKRMILKSIDILSCDELESQPYYSFEYSTTAPPPRWGNNRDYFGYCNAINALSSQNNFQAFVTNSKSPFDATYGQDATNRSVTDNVAIMAALCLTKVKNAYGGSLSFQYELHSDLSSVTDGLGLPDTAGNLATHLFLGKKSADGLRLFRTVTEDKYHPGNKLITTYSYSGGQFFLNGGYYAYPTIQNANGDITQYYGTANWVSPHQLINGSNHGYSQVTVTTTTENTNTLLSKTIHYFSNFKDGTLLDNYKLNGPSGATKDYFQLPYTDKQYILDWKVGLPLKTETFDKNGNITSRITNNYNMDIASDFISADPGLGVNVHVMRVSKLAPDNANNIVGNFFNIATDSYVPFRGKSLLSSTTSEKFINNSSSVSDVVEYKYDDSFNLTQTKNRNSRNEYFLSRNIYNYNITGSTDLTAMTNAGFEKVVSTERWRKGSTSPSGDQLMDASITTFKYDNGVLLTQKVQTLQSLTPLSYNDYTTSGTAPYNRILTAYNNPTQSVTDFKVISEVLQYDLKNNPTMTQLGGQNSYISMIWSQVNGNKLAEANCKVNEMGFTGFETEDQGNWYYDEANVITSSNASETMDGHRVLKAYSYNTDPFLVKANLTPNKEYTVTFWSKGGVIHITGGGITGDIPYTQLYGDNNFNSYGWRYYQAKFTPIYNLPIEFSLISTGSPFTNYIDDVRIFPSGATMNSSNYEPFRGVSSSIDPSGRITYYEYDSFGRLVLTRNQEGNIISKKDFHLAQ